MNNNIHNVKMSFLHWRYEHGRYVCVCVYACYLCVCVCVYVFLEMYSKLLEEEESHGQRVRMEANERHV